MNIRLARPGDLNFIYQLKLSCVKRMKEENIDQWDEFYPNIYTFEKDIEEQSLFVYKNSDSIIGCIVINERQEPEYKEVNWTYKKARVCVIHRLMVNPLFQSQGIAKELMFFAEYLAKERNYQAIRLDAFIDNPRAVRFYQKLGYQEVGHVTFRKGKFLCFEKLLT